MRVRVVLVVVACLALRDFAGGSLASHPYQETATSVNYLWRSLEHDGVSSLTYSVCGDDKWRTAVETWDAAMTRWEFTHAGACQPAQIRLAWEGSSGEQMCSPGAVGCWRHNTLNTFHGTHWDLINPAIYFDAQMHAAYTQPGEVESIAAHEWGHNMSLTEHPAHGQCGGQTVMAYFDPGEFYCFQGPSPNDASSVNCKVYGYCDTDGDGYDKGVENHVGTDPEQRCGFADISGPSDHWPSDISEATAFTQNKVNISDLATFVSPFRRLGKNPGDTLFNPRWDLKPGRTIGATISVEDLAVMTTGLTGYPPMFDGIRAFTGPQCSDN